MREQSALHAASVKRTAAAFSIPVHHLRRAVAAGELQTYSSGGRTSLLIHDDVKAWLRSRPALRQPKNLHGSKP
jgi:hypothetical protein